jgi:hypothetical protein
MKLILRLEGCFLIPTRQATLSCYWHPSFLFLLERSKEGNRVGIGMLQE